MEDNSSTITKPLAKGRWEEETYYQAQDVNLTIVAKEDVNLAVQDLCVMAFVRSNSTRGSSMGKDQTDLQGHMNDF